MKILILADDCNPEWPSLPLVGYNMAKALADLVSVTVVTHVRNRENIEKHGFGNVADVIYINNESIARPLHKLSQLLRGGDAIGWTTNVAINYPMYISFEAMVWSALEERLRAGEFDVVHRLTPMSPCIPSPMATLCKSIGVPFVLGPLNGGLEWPRGFESEAHREKEWLTPVRSLYKLLPFHDATYRDSARVLHAFEHTRNDIPDNGNLISEPEVGYDPNVFWPEPLRPPVRKGSQINFLFVGRLVPYKMPILPITCFARSELLRTKARLTIIGAGPEEAAMQRMINDHSLHDCVEMFGALRQDVVARHMRNNHCFVFPSIRELGAGVVIEAMASGCVPIVVDHGGPGGLVDGTTGTRVPVIADLEGSFRTTLEQYVAFPQGINTMRGVCIEKAHKMSWHVKATRFSSIYRDVVRSRD